MRGPRPFRNVYGGVPLPANPLNLYSAWSGTDTGTPVNPTRCITVVSHDGVAGYTRQCMHPNGHGPDGMFCKNHAKKAFKITKGVK